MISRTIIRAFRLFEKRYIRSHLVPFAAGCILSGVTVSILAKKRDALKCFDEKQAVDVNHEDQIVDDVKDHLPPTVPYIIIGNGTAAYYTAVSIMSTDHKAKVILNRNAFFLKYLKESLESLEGLDQKYSFPYFEQAVPFSSLLSDDQGHVSYFVNTTVTEIDSDEKKITLDGGEIMHYSKLIIANEMKEIPHPILKSDLSDKILKISNVDDYSALVLALKNQPKVVTILGSNAHAFSLGVSISKLIPGSHVYVINEGPSILDLLPPHLKDKMVEYFAKKNLFIKPGKVENASTVDGKLILGIDDSKIECDLVALFNSKIVDDRYVGGKDCKGIKCLQSTTLGRAGYFVDVDQLGIETDILTAGDNSCYKTEVPLAFEPAGFEYSYTTASVAGKNACGSIEKYTYLPFKICNITDRLRYQLVGDCSPSLETVSVWKTGPKDIVTRPGIVLYHQDGLVVGMMLWNINNKLDLADEVISSKTKIEDSVEVAKWFLPRSDLNVEEVSKIIPVDDPKY
ncbi:Apoptosis-inducing factor 1, mitochondrial [Thelohanellus kitauei]|uniref:Apoptosis-inducing factor 1, mitochondrial n=1 Tax=Thelohanellus kitauei TaxID=669202 RepID=A0A0C2IWX7_THEKT|nr:Apoptosis-inducing factor 1, mitochondrial [Thelohanellus kitauei]